MLTSAWPPFLKRRALAVQEELVEKPPSNQVRATGAAETCQEPPRIEGHSPNSGPKGGRQ